MRTINGFLAVVMAIAGSARVTHAQTAMAQMQLATPQPTPTSKSATQPSNPHGANKLYALLSAKSPGDTTTVVRRNPYVGAQAGYVFGGGDFASNLVANGSVVYNVLQTAGDGDTTWHFFLPVRGNVASLVAAKDAADSDKQAQNLVTGTQGIRVSLEPYLALPSSRFLGTGLFASLGWKLNAVKDASDSTRYLSLGRFAVGAEGILGGSDGSPIVVDISSVYSTFAGRDYRSIPGLEKSIWSGELTVVVPVGTSTGFLTEAVVAQRAFPVWRTGLVLSAASK